MSRIDRIEKRIISYAVAQYNRREYRKKHLDKIKQSKVLTAPFIPNTDKLNEAEVKARLYYEVSKLPVYVSMERLVPKSTCRYDLGFHVDENSSPFCLVEVKDTTCPRERTGRQINAYENCGIPFMYCNGLAEIEGVVEFVKACLLGQLKLDKR